MKVDPGRVSELFAEVGDDDPGYSVAISVDGNIEYAAAFGLASLELSVPATPGTVYEIASTSKQFTAATVLELAAAGALSLADPVRRFLPELPATLFDSIAVQHLLNHSAGIPDYLVLMALSGRDGRNTYPAAEIRDLVVSQRRFDFSPGSRFSYSNTGYLLLADIVERLTATSLREQLTERFFQPLGMAATRLRDDNTMVIPSRATGYAQAERAAGWAVSESLFDVVGDGMIHSTALDLLRWAAHLESSSGAELAAGLAAESVLGGGGDYRNGVIVDRWRDQRRLHHAGAWAGFRAQLTRYPELGLAIAVLANRADAQASDLVDALAAAILDPDRSSNQPDGPRLAEVAVDVTIPTGSYLDEFESTLSQLSREVDGSYRLHGPSGSLRFRATGADRLESNDGARIARRSDGELLLSTRSEGEVALRLLDPADGSQPAAGLFRSEELAAQVRISEVDSTWYVQLGWQPPCELVAAGSGYFSAAGAVIRFTPDHDRVLIAAPRSHPQEFGKLA